MDPWELFLVFPRGLFFYGDDGDSRFLRNVGNFLSYCDMTLESRNIFIARQRLGKHIPDEANAPNIRIAVFSMVSALRLYNEDFTQLEIELSLGSWHLQQRLVGDGRQPESESVSRDRVHSQSRES
jgi:hypothetical protein